MTYARKNLVSLTDTTYYHVVARCVRRAWLWGYDSYAGRDYSHRKQWVLARLDHLVTVFTIEICSYAIMSNHYHLVLHLDKTNATRLTAREVALRWSKLFTLPPIMRGWLEGSADPAESKQAEAIVETWRVRLYDISWFMKCLNEHLARRANAEDEVTGRFWEGRFRSQALLDEGALLTAMTYVDLNPIRAGLSETPEQSDFTSVRQRIDSLRRRGKRTVTGHRPRLQPFSDRNRCTGPSLPFTTLQYLQLVDWSGRLIRADKPGHIEAAAPPIMARLRIDAAAWRSSMRPRGNVFGRAIGKLSRLKHHARTLGQHWIRGQGRAAVLFAS